MFLAQGYPHKELVIVDDGTDRIDDLIPAHPQIRYFREEPRRMALGAKRNRACELARGDVILVWDDDDWYAPWRIAYQVREMETNGWDLCGINRAFFVDPASKQAWEYVAMSRGSRWLCGATLGFRRSLWEANRFANVRVGEDNRFVAAARGANVGVLQNNRFFVCRIHSRNTCTKRPARWPPVAFRAIQSIIGVDWEEYFGTTRGLPQGSTTGGFGTALVTAASGIGDILRVTPLMRVAYQLGYDVDVLLAPDDPAAADLLRGAREIRRVLLCSSIRRTRAAYPVAEIREEQYDVATFTGLSKPLAGYVAAKARYCFDEKWRSAGEMHCIEQVARSLGWQGELPAPFAVRSSRYFDISPSTIAIHPGCKPNWPWKKWHGFDELAALFEEVVIVGTESDLENTCTYFNRPFIWPEHSRDFVGKLDLCDTAALLSQCSALIAPDSGVMHLGAALRVPTFGIFGITSPQRECLDSPFMVPITKQLACETACRQIAGRRDCERHLECLATLAPSDVAAFVKATLKRFTEVEARALKAPARDAKGTTARRDPTPVRPRAASVGTRGGTATRTRRTPVPTAFRHANRVSRRTATDRTEVTPFPAIPARAGEITVNYHCADIPFASGFGQAARAYIRALHTVGVRVRVASIAGRRAEVEDPLVASLVGRYPDADFDIFHGVPSQWTRFLSGARNPILVTVWEADQIPPQWIAPLSRALDIWVPSRFNVELFLKNLGRIPFRLPHALPTRAPELAPVDTAGLGIAPDDFVFYSIFKWEDRKNPRGLIEAFLRAFTHERDAVLLIKTNSRAAVEARAVVEALRQKISSDGRILLHCTLFDEGRMRALQARGNCYVSLHLGEGWGYPLFEASALGTPIVATGYGGPLDYLDSGRHWLVRSTLAHVQRPHYLYRTSMRWAEPDIAHASEGMRWAYEYRSAVRESAAAASREIQAKYSLEHIGMAAKDRLTALLS
jgi:ADP-heptose:LPS heptosyltransferase/glycosyltransferase involved in cell wall biosynthesis